MDKEQIINDFTEENGEKDFNKDWYYSMLNFCNGSSPDDKDKSNDDLWWKLFPLLLTFANQPQSNTLLEKEVAYMRGRLDVLEKIVMDGERK